MFLYVGSVFKVAKVRKISYLCRTKNSQHIKIMKKIQTLVTIIVALFISSVAFAQEPTSIRINTGNATGFGTGQGLNSNVLIENVAGDALIFTATGDRRDEMLVCNIVAFPFNSDPGFIVRLSSTSASRIVVWGQSGGPGARSIASIAVSDSPNGPFVAVSGFPGAQTWAGDGDAPNNRNEGCWTWTIENLNIQQGSYVRIMFNTGQTRLGGVDIYPTTGDNGGGEEPSDHISVHITPLSGGVGNGANAIGNPYGDTLFFTSTGNARTEMNMCGMTSFPVNGDAGFVLKLGSTSASELVVWGNSSGAAADRTINSIEIGNSLNGPFTNLPGGFNATGQTPGQGADPDGRGDQGCWSWTITGIEIPCGTYVRIRIRGNFRLGGVDILPIEGDAGCGNDNGGGDNGDNGNGENGSGGDNGDETSVSVIDNTKMLKVYPNPVSDVLHIQTEQTIQKIVVMDMFGRTVKTQIGDHRTIYVGTLASGIYIVNIHTATAIIPTRIHVGTSR